MKLISRIFRFSILEHYVRYVIRDRDGNLFIEPYDWVCGGTCIKFAFFIWSCFFVRAKGKFWEVWFLDDAQISLFRKKRFMLDGIVKNKKYSTWVFVFKKYSKCYYRIYLVGNIIKHKSLIFEECVQLALKPQIQKKTKISFISWTCISLTQVNIF